MHVEWQINVRYMAVVAHFERKTQLLQATRRTAKCPPLPASCEVISYHISIGLKPIASASLFYVEVRMTFETLREPFE